MAIKEVFFLRQGDFVRLNLPNIQNETIVFSKTKPYFYMIEETEVQKYSYRLTI